MKQGRSLQEMAAELQRQAESKKDYLAPQGKLSAVVDGGRVKLAGINGGFEIDNHAHSQIGTHLGIPAKYYERMRTEQPDLLAANLNVWLAKNGDEKRMVRTLDNRVRAFMSSKFRPLDNFDLAQTILPVLIKAKAQIVSCELTETRMYIKAILPELSDVMPEGIVLGSGHNRVDRGTVVSAIVIANSEVGNGSLRVEPSVFTTSCTNLMVLAEAAMKKYHVGKGFDASENFEVFSDATRQADDRAFFLKVSDVTKAAFDPKVFAAAIADMKKSGERVIVSKDLPKVVEVAVKRLALPEGITGSVLTHLAAGGDLTQWGLSSAVTRVANDFDDYEGATELERAGGKIINLAPSEWKAISEAAA